MDRDQPNQANKATLWKVFGVILYFFTLCVFFVGIIYFIWSLVLIINQTQPTTIAQTVLNILSLLVEALGIFYTVMLFKHMGTTSFHPPHVSEDEELHLDDFPLVSILIPIHKPEPKILGSTLDSITKANYPQEKIQIILGDDTDSTFPSLPVIREMANNYSAEYVYDTTNLHFKAGMLNIRLKSAKADFIVFLDYDHKITRNFLNKSIAILTEYKDIAFVQSKVGFYNIKSKLQIWEAVMYAQFFEVFERSKNRRSTVLFNGSTACFRKKIIDEIGGIPTATFTEDIDLSVQILSRGYKSKLLDDYGSFGLIPSSFSLLLSQILRWAKGSMHTLKLRWKKILTGKMSPFDKVDLYFSTLLFFIASSMYLTIMFYVIMYFTDSRAIRLPIQQFPPLIIMPVALAIAYQISGLIAVLFTRRSKIIEMNMLDLILFFIIALALNPFTVYAVVRTIFRFRPPMRDKDEWNEKVPFITLSLIFSLLGIGITTLAYFDFISGKTLWVVLGLLGLSLIATFPVCMYLHLTTRHNKPYFINDINYITE